MHKWNLSASTCYSPPLTLTHKEGRETDCLGSLQTFWEVSLGYCQCQYLYMYTHEFLMEQNPSTATHVNHYQLKMHVLF